ncbi:MAG TPA: hypothetical protein VJR29_05220 [bacterium]|nr:hypothetical protein [bacterium]
MAGLRPLLESPACGTTERAELLAIAGEKDPELRQDALRSFASRQEAKGRPDYAAAAYQLTLNIGDDSRARRRLKALLGEGNFGDRAEQMLGNFFRQAASPEMLGGMAAGSLVGQAIQAFSLSRLLGAEASAFTRGFGARSLATALGLSGEVPAVVLTSKGLQEAQGHSADWSARALGHEFSAMAVSLSLLKCGSALGHRAQAGFDPAGIGSRLSTALLPTASAGTALFAAHRFESWIGLRPPSDAASALFDSAAMLLQLQVGGRLLNSVTGGALSRTLGELQLRSRLAETPRFPEGPQAFGAWDFAEVHARRGGMPALVSTLPPRDAAKKLGAEINQMSSLNGHGLGDRFLKSRLPRRLSELLGVEESDPRVASIVDNYGKTPFHYREGDMRSAYFEMLTRTQLRGTEFLAEGREIPAVDLMHSAGLILRRAMEMNPFHGGSGSFYDYLTQVAFERTLRGGNVPAFDALVYTLAVRQSPAALESFFREHQLHFPYERQAISRHNQPLNPTPVLRKLEEFPVSEKVRFWLSEYILSYEMGLHSNDFPKAPHNQYFSHDGQTHRRNFLDRDDVFDSLHRIFADPANRRAWSQGLEELVRRAEKSPVPLLYFDRFFKLVGSGDLTEKISELVADSSYNPFGAWQGSSINGTVYTGFLTDPVLSQRFREFYRVLPELLHPEQSSQRRVEYRAKAAELLEGRENFGADQILELLYQRPTARAIAAREAIQSGEVGLEVLTRDGMEALMKALHPAQKIGNLHDALYLPASRSPTGRPYIAILELDPRLSREQKIARALFLAGYVVHEYDHHLHSPQFNIRKRGDRLKLEMRGWLEENLYLLTQGEKSVWEDAELYSPTGFGVYLRTHIERQYLHEDRDYLQKLP